MKRLEQLDPDDASFDQALATLMREIREHVAEEESEMFPHMRQVFSQQELVELGARVESVKKMAPTRPHPSAPDEPPATPLTAFSSATACRRVAMPLLPASSGWPRQSVRCTLRTSRRTAPRSSCSRRAAGASDSTCTSGGRGAGWAKTISTLCVKLRT